MITLFGIKSCDTVRKAKKWLDVAKLDYHYHDFREAGLDKKTLTGWVNVIGWEILLNTRSTSWRQLAPEKKQPITAASAVALMLENPTLIKRPVLDQDGDILVGFKEADYQQLI